MRHHFDCDGRRISYLEMASQGRATGTLVLLHAFPLAAEMWQPQFAAVPSNWRVVAPDLAGFGQSSADTAPEPVIDAYARDVLALLDHLRVDAAVIGGLSMGGYISFAFLRLAPARCRGLILADTRPEADTEAARAGRLKLIETLDREGAAGVADSMIPKLLGATTRSARPAVVSTVRALAASQPGEALRRATVSLMSRPDSTPLLRDILSPVLVVVGEEDEITGPDIARQMHGQIAGAELAVIGRAGHLSNLEQPDEFNLALSRFLATRFA